MLKNSAHCVWLYAKIYMTYICQILKPSTYNFVFLFVVFAMCIFLHLKPMNVHEAYSLSFKTLCLPQAFSFI